MHFGSLRDFCRTLRFRLTAWNTGVVLALVLGALFGVREVLRRSLIHEFDQTLREDALEVDLTVKRLYHRPALLQENLNRKALSHSHRSWFVQLFDAQGDILWSSLNTPEIVLPLLAPRSTPVVWEEYHLQDRSVVMPDDTHLLVRVGSSVQSLEEDLTLLTRTMLLAGGAILVLTPLAGYYLSGRSTRPLSRMIHTASRLRPDDLSDRLPIRGTGDELDRLALTINGLLDHIAAYLDRKRDFIANAAHELRSPLAAIQSSVDVALTGVRTPEEYIELLLEVGEVCNGLGVLVNRLLLLSESDAGKLTADGQVVRLDRIVSKALAMFQGLAEHKDILLVSGRLDEALVPGLEPALQQVVHNLIDNAIKFNRPGGEVKVELQTDPVGRQVVFQVSDTGVGIPDEDLPHIFERFYRGDKSRQRLDGTGNGLGLSICQAVVTGSRGSIQVGSAPGQGSCFRVVLPLARPTASR